jgi:choline dehydrogenase-like flavoprotein
MTTTELEQAEVVIVGAGPSGAIAALELARSGLSVVCLEQGDWVDPARFTGDKRSWELTADQRWHYNPNRRLALADYPVDDSESEVPPAMFNGVGGSTILWSAAWPRLAPSDFRVRSLDGVAEDWPICYEELVPFYDEVERDIGISGLAGDPAYPPRGDYPMPQLPVGRTGMAGIRGMDRLGWHWWVGSTAIATQPYRRLNPCARIGTCNTGCPEGAKASVDVTHWPDALEHGVKLVTGARVREITVNADGMADGVVYIREGQAIRQPARIVICCANGIGTPRLLLMSANATHPEGLGNSSGMVGRNLMMHGMSAVIGCFDEPLESWLGPFTAWSFTRPTNLAGSCAAPNGSCFPAAGRLRCTRGWPALRSTTAGASRCIATPPSGSDGRWAGQSSMKTCPTPKTA